jgi:acyl-ACP thioesterase
MQEREDRFTVKTFDCRPDGSIKPNALMQYLQEAAARHAEELGFGFADLERQNSFWVLANLRLEVARLPQWNEDFTIRTWPSGHTHVVASREFVGLDGNGSELFRAGSHWMVLHKQKSRPRNLSRLELRLPPDGPKALATAPQRLQPTDGCTRAHVLRVPASALDFNQHVNNTEYIRWAFDALHFAFTLTDPIQMLEATYLAEVFAGDEIEILVRPTAPNSFHVQERRCSDGADVFVMKATC